MPYFTPLSIESVSQASLVQLIGKPSTCKRPTPDCNHWFEAGGRRAQVQGTIQHSFVRITLLNNCRFWATCPACPLVSTGGVRSINSSCSGLMAAVAAVRAALRPPRPLVGQAHSKQFSSRGSAALLYCRSTH